MKLYIVYLLVIVNYRLFFGFFECLGVYFLCFFFVFFYLNPQIDLFVGVSTFLLPLPV